MKTSKVKKITKTEKQTYDITIKNNHNFFCNKHLIHNCNYNGEIKAIIFNTNQQPYTIKKGMKVAQAVLSPVVNGGWVDLEEVKEITDKERGSNGFGSTGI
jgi:dUTPase